MRAAIAMGVLVIAGIVTAWLLIDRGETPLRVAVAPLAPVDDAPAPPESRASDAPAKQPGAIAVAPFDASTDELEEDPGERRYAGKVRLQAVFEDGTPLAATLMRLLPSPGEVTPPVAPLSESSLLRIPPGGRGTVRETQEWTDDAGVAWIDAVEGEGLVEVALEPRYGTGTYRVKLPPHTTRRRIVVPSGDVVRGRFVLPSGRGAAGVQWSAAVMPRAPEVRSRSEWRGAPRCSGVADATGRFVIRSLRPDDRVSVFVPVSFRTRAVSGAVPASASVMSPRAEEYQIPIEGVPSLRGRIRDAAAPGAELPTHRIAMYRCRPGTDSVLLCSVETEPDGRFECPLMEPPGTPLALRVFAMHPWQMRAIHPFTAPGADGADLGDVELPPLVPITILVVDDLGEPVGGAIGRADFGPPIGIALVCRTEPDGHAEVRVFADTTLTFSRGGYAPRAIVANVAGNRALRLTLDRRLSLVVRVRDQSGEPFDEPAVVRVQAGRGELVEEKLIRGEARFNALAPDEPLVVEVVGELDARVRWTQSLTLGSDRLTEITATVAVGAAFTIVAHDADGPLATATGTVTVRNPEGDHPRTFPLVAGRAFIHGIHDPFLQLEVSVAGFQVVNQVRFAVPASGSTWPILLQR